MSAFESQRLRQYARVMELVDLRGLEPRAAACRCKSCLGHQNYGLVMASIAVKRYRYSKLITYYQKQINNKIFNSALIAGNHMVAACA